MERPDEFRSGMSNLSSPAATTVAAFLFTLILTLAATGTAQGQTYGVIYSFTGQADGSFPAAGLTADTQGNLSLLSSFHRLSQETTVIPGNNKGYSGQVSVFELGSAPAD